MSEVVVQAGHVLTLGHRRVLTLSLRSEALRVFLSAYKDDLWLSDQRCRHISCIS